jgi:hypothetical protein
MRIMVIDGQGGGIGVAIIKGIRDSIGNDIEILALGTNSIATSRMMKSGANKGGTGENAIVNTSQRVDIIIGPLSIIMANSMMGELTPKMAASVGSSDAEKILIPLTQERIRIMGTTNEPLPHLVRQVVDEIKEICGNV